MQAEQDPDNAGGPKAHQLLDKATRRKRISNQGIFPGARFRASIKKPYVRAEQNPCLYRLHAHTDRKDAPDRPVPGTVLYLRF